LYGIEWNGVELNKSVWKCKKMIEKVCELNIVVYRNVCKWMKEYVNLMYSWINCMELNGDVWNCFRVLRLGWIEWIVWNWMIWSRINLKMDWNRME
jgi:hypothetical protein